MNYALPKTGVLVALLHETLKTESFATIGDLAEAVKVRAARLRLPYDAGTLTQAMALVAHTRPLTRAAEFVELRLGLDRLESSAPVLSWAEAAEIYNALWARYRQERAAVAPDSPAGPTRPEHFPDLVEVTPWR